MQLYLVRHGETKWNREKRYYGSSDIPLNERGKQQAEQVARLLEEVSFDRIYTSPLLRAKQTTFLIQQQNKQIEKTKIIETKLLSEQSLGIFEGYTYHELKQKFPKELQKWNQNWKAGIPEGESFFELYERVLTFCQEVLELEGIGREQGMIQRKKMNQQQEKILLVSHEAVFKCLCILLLKMKADSIWNFTFEQGAYSRIDIEDGYAIVRKINAVSCYFT